MRIEVKKEEQEKIKVRSLIYLEDRGQEGRTRKDQGREFNISRG